MPLKRLKTTKLQVVRKIFADDPELNLTDLISNQTQCYSYEGESLEDSQYLMCSYIVDINESQAAMYEEFELQKIKCNGTRQARILGINKYKIFNKHIEKQEGGDFLNFSI